MYRPFKNLRMRMVQLDYNQEELGKAAGIPKATLSQRINGNRPFDAYQISALCKVLEIKPEEIGTFFFEDMTKSRKGAA